MYSGADLDTLMTELDSLTASGFLEYDFNVGQVIPYLKITVSQAQLALFPLLKVAPQGQKIINLYYTIDFSPSVADFITAMNAGITATVDSNAALMAAINTQIGNWSSFDSTYNSYG